MSKKKLSKKEKYERRLREMEKALGRVQTKPKDAVVQADEYQLPIVEIKKDLFKNLIYAIFSVVIVVMLKLSGVNFLTLFPRQ